MKKARIFCLDEWLFHDLLGENGKVCQRETTRLLTTIHKQCDRIVVPWESPWAQKAYKLIKYSSNSPILRNVAKLLSSAFLWNTNKGISIYSSKGSPNPETMDMEEIPEEDRYLVRAALAAGASLLVTTDEKLLEAIQKHDLLKGEHRDSFIKGYEAFFGEKPLF